MSLAKGRLQGWVDVGNPRRLGIDADLEACEDLDDGFVDPFTEEIIGVVLPKDPEMVVPGDGRVEMWARAADGPELLPHVVDLGMERRVQAQGLREQKLLGARRRKHLLVAGQSEVPVDACMRPLSRREGNCGRANMTSGAGRRECECVPT